MVCALFGHRDTPGEIKDDLEKELRRLLEEKREVTFLVGNQGAFDNIVYQALKSLCRDYEKASYAVVLAYMPRKATEKLDYAETIYPEGLERVPRRFAISHRNRWMASQADLVIAYITHSWGGAAQAVEYARRKGTPIINLAKK